MLLGGMVMALFACGRLQAAAAPAPQASGPQALGVIVKLKDGRLTTADGRGMARPSSFSPEVAQRRRLQAAHLAQRHRVSFLVQKDTVFGAQVLHSGVPVALKEAQAQAQRLRQDPDVEWAVPNEIMKAASVTAQPVPSVDYSGRFWIRSRAEAGVGVADFPAAWEFLAGRTLSPVLTAVLDSGVTGAFGNDRPSTHPDFTGRLLTGYDFVSDIDAANDGNGRDDDVRDPGDADAGCPADPKRCSSWHGTSIVGMLASPGSSVTEGVLGDSQRMGPGILAPIDGQPVVLPVRIGGVGGASSSDIIEAMYWAAGLEVPGESAPPRPGARVISLSYGSVGNCQGGAATVDALYRNAIATLRSLGVVIVASAGNGEDVRNTGSSMPSKPASCQGVIAATGLRASASKASYANLVNGTRISRCYFGVATVGGDDEEGLAMLSNTGRAEPESALLSGGIAGTSFAAPQVAGVAALMLSLNPSLSSVDVAHRIMQSATPFPVSGPSVCGGFNLGNCRCTTSTCGAGVLSARDAVESALRPRFFDEGVCPSPDVMAAPTRSGGGGSSDLSLLALLAAVAAWMLGLAALQRFQGRAAHLTTGKQ